MRAIVLLVILMLGILPVYGQKMVSNKTEYKKDCSNCKFLLNEAGKAYEVNFKEALNKNIVIHNYAKELIDLEKLSVLKLKAERAFKASNMNEYYSNLEKIKTISIKYISDFAARTKGDAYIFIDLGHVENDTLRYNIYVDSGVKYGKLRVYFNLETNQLAHIKADAISYKSFMNKNNGKAKNIKIWLFKDYNTLAYVMNNETKADKDFIDICDNFLEYRSKVSSNTFTLVNAQLTTTTNISLKFKNCNP